MPRDSFILFLFHFLLRGGDNVQLVNDMRYNVRSSVTRWL